MPRAVQKGSTGCSWPPTSRARQAEMVGAMVVPVAVACLLWRFGLGAVIPWVSDTALGTSSHVAMYVGMLLAMLYRFADYGHTGPRGHGM